MGEQMKGSIFLVIAMLIFGFLGIAAKSLASSPLMLLYAMQVMGVLSFFFVLLKTKKFAYKGFMKLILIMTFFVLLSDFSFFTAVKLTSIANAVFIKFTAPIFILIFVPLIINEKRERRSFYAIPVALLGLFLILYQGSFVFDTNMTGMLFAMITAVSLAFFLIYVKKITVKLDLYTMLFYRYFISTIALTPIVLLVESFTISNTVLTGLIIFGLLFTIVGTSIHMEGVKRIKAQHAGILGYIEPLSATVYGIFLLSEVPTLFTIIGGALILLSAYFVIKK